MSGTGKPRVLGVAFALIFISISALSTSVPVVAAQAAGQTAPLGPLAARLNAAKSVFVSDTKGKKVATEKARDDQAGASFYAAMKSWNRYILAPAATDADLLLQISLDDSQVQLTVVDPKTRVVLASLIEPVEDGLLLSTRERNLNQATSALVDDLRRLAIQRQRPKVFLSNVGSDDDLYSGIGMSSSDGWSEAFNKFYAAMQSSGQYELMSSPAGASLIFEMSYADPREETGESRDRPFSYTIFHPQVHLVIRDASTLAVQGAFTELIKIGLKQPERDARFSQALYALVNDAGRQLGRPPATTYVPRVVPVAPVPPQISAAKTVFISNAATDQAYNEFYAMMNSWGEYQLSSTATGADLIFELSSPSGQVHLAILDPRTKVALWGIALEARRAIIKSNAQKNIDNALATLVENLAKLTGRPALSISVPNDIKDAPGPSQIGSAKTAFIANGGGEIVAEGKIALAYDDFYATMKSWGRYELVPAPAEADLVFQISLAGSDIQLAILDSKTRAVLWGLHQKIHEVSRGTVQQNDLDAAMAALVKSTARLAGQPAAEIAAPAGTNSAPVPPSISGSRKIFLSRPEDDSDFFEKQAPDQLYNQIYAGMKSWGQYELTTPSEADLILEPSAPSDWVRLTIRDAKSHHVLWTLTRPVKSAFLNSNATKNYIAATGLLVDDLHRVASLSHLSGVNAAKRVE